MKDHFDFKGQVAIITGCSSGIGVQMAHALASYGANIVLLARRKNLIEELASQLREKYSIDTLPLTCDVTDTKQIKSAIDEIMSKFSRIDILINNAGCGIGKPAEEINDEEFMNDIDLDLTSVFRVSREVAASAMIKQKYGRIINISSIYGVVGNNIEKEFGVPYYAAKGGVISMTKALAAEWAKHNITVNAICPGYFYTPISKANLDNKEFLGTIKNRIPMGRIGNEGELDTAVLFLASKKSSYITGISLPVDGGYTCI